MDPREAPLKIIYTTASRLGGTGLSKVAHHAVRAIYNADSLVKVITYGNRQSDVPRHLIKILRPMMYA